MNKYLTDFENFVITPRQLWVQVNDGNLSGPIEFSEFMSLEDVQNLLEDSRGVWTRLPGTDGDVLLDRPEAWVFLAKPADVDPYPDYVVTEKDIEHA